MIAAGKLGGIFLKRLPTSGRVAILTLSEPSPIYDARLKGVNRPSATSELKTLFKRKPLCQCGQSCKNAEAEDVNHYIKGWFSR